MVKRRCAALGCVSTEDSEGVTFHCFPTRDEQRRLWLEALGAPSLTARRVCSLHFDQSAFKSTPDPPKTAGLKRRRLRCDAIPMPGASNSAAAEQATEDASEESLVAAELDEDAVMSPAEDFHVRHLINEQFKSNTALITRLFSYRKAAPSLRHLTTELVPMWKLPLTTFLALRCVQNHQIQTKCVQSLAE